MNPSLWYLLFADRLRLLPGRFPPPDRWLFLGVIVTLGLWTWVMWRHADRHDNGLGSWF